MNNDINNFVITSPKVVGLRETLRGIIEGSVRCVIVATDCDGFVREQAAETAKEHGIDLVMYQNGMKELGKLCGIEVSCAVVGILKQPQ